MMRHSRWITACVALALVLGAALHLVGAEANKAPDFTLKDLNGNSVSLADHKDKIVVLEWINRGCPYVVRHYKEKTHTSIAADYKDKGVVYLAIDSSHDQSDDRNRQWVEQHSIAYPILNDASGEVGRAYGARTTPHMFIIQDGVIVYNGAIDDDARGSNQPGERINYVRRALDELLAGSAVSVATTRPYGCGVKYQR
jgi:peroxiredoxin